MVKKREIICDYQPLIFSPPKPKDDLYRQACSNDEATINHWREIWLNNISANHENLGPFKDKGVGNLFGKHKGQPVIIAGSGPSLRFNAHELKNKDFIPLVSCLHNFHYLEDNGVPADYYVSLDAGPVTVEEVSEGGQKTPEEYWEITKDRVLIAFIGSDPKLIEKWQGEIYWFAAPIPDQEFQDKVDEIEVFHTNVSNGGNVLGACLYIAKAFLGAGSIVFIGADFSFGYDRRFHGWDSKYDEKMGQCVPLTDIFGVKVPTWPTYSNFKGWFDWVTMHVPGIYINASEGGCLGSYPEGNLNSLRYMDLKDCIEMYTMSDKIREQAINPSVGGIEGKKILF